jgi:hypothetical protein
LSEQDELPEKRPFLVALIFWLHVLAVLAFVWTFSRLIAHGARLRTPTAAAAVLLIAVKMWGAAELYRLKRSAVSIFLTSVLLNLPLTIYDIYRHPHGYQLSGIISMGGGAVVAAGVCLYSLHLARVGVLR